MGASVREKNITRLGNLHLTRQQDSDRERESKAGPIAEGEDFTSIVQSLGCCNLQFADPSHIPGSRGAAKNKNTPQKNPRVRKIRVRNSGAGNGCANFMDTWKKCVLSAGKTMSVKFPFFWGGGGGVPILFLWARGFFLKNTPQITPWSNRKGAPHRGARKMHSWTHVRRNGAFGARAQFLYSTIDYRNKAF